MLEQPVPPQQPPQTTPSGSNKKWIGLVIGGGCIALACVGLIIGVVLYFIPVISRTVSPTSIIENVVPVTPTSIAENLVPVTPGPAQPNAPSGGPSNTMGDPNAPVKIVEYADFQCPYCLRYWQETEPQIIDNYVKTGKVYYEYRSVGDFIGPESGAAAQAAYCAGDQGKFWQYHDTLFSHWTGENVGDFADSKLTAFAAALGLDQAAFDSCLHSGKYASRLEQDVNNAKADGVQATPSFLINGTLMEGAQPYSAFQQAIEAALQGK